MESSFSCPACVSNEWDDVGTHFYWRVEHEPGGIWYWDTEVRIRRKVLFEVWLPEAVVVTLRSRRCRQCGLICYAPRPSEDDLRRKYDYLRAARLESALIEPSPQVEISDYERALAILDVTAPYLASGALVLDVGGGDGRLMRPFVDRGFECFLVDRVDHTRPGVRKLANSLESLSAQPAFDVAVCSHVLEHVASPRQMLQEIHARLRQGGIVYVEVPLEVFFSNARNPIVAEPVEHINFFTPTGIAQVLSVAGFEHDGAQVTWSSYEGRQLPVIRAVGLRPKCAQSGDADQRHLR